MNAAPTWLHNCTVSGLQALYALSLPGSPAAEVLPMTVEVWVRTLAAQPIAWTKELDEMRIAEAFVHLAGTCDRWPSPRLMLANMPPRKQPVALPPAPRQPPPPGALDRLRALSRRMTMTPTLRRNHSTNEADHKRGNDDE